MLSGALVEALQSCDANDVVARLQESLPLEQASMKQPDPETKRQIRCLCLKAKSAKRLDVIKSLREIVPAGTTGEVFGISIECRRLEQPVRFLPLFSRFTELLVDLIKYTH